MSKDLPLLNSLIPLEFSAVLAKGRGNYVSLRRLGQAISKAEGLFALDFYRDAMLALREGGIIVQQSESPLLHTDSIIKGIHEDMRKAGFEHVQTMPFPQPVYPTGWWSCTMASKENPIKYFREEDANNRPFVTRYYNSGVHHGALAMPQFMVDALEDEVRPEEG